MITEIITEKSLYQNQSIVINVGKTSFETDVGLHGRLPLYFTIKPLGRDGAEGL